LASAIRHARSSQLTALPGSMVKAMKAAKDSKAASKQQHSVRKAGKAQSGQKQAGRLAASRSQKPMKASSSQHRKASKGGKKAAMPMKAKKTTKTLKTTRSHTPSPPPMKSSSSARASGKASSSRQLKTKLCNFWSEGKCRRGETCEFAHGSQEQAECRRAVPCRFHLGSVYPTSCHFAHADGMREAAPASSSDGRPAKEDGLGPGKKTKILKRVYSDEGEVEQNEKPQKTLLCKFWLKGRCAKIVGCGFAHGEEEQRAACAQMRCRFDIEGDCRQGASCWYVHAESQQGPVVAALPFSGYKTTIRAPPGLGPAPEASSPSVEPEVVFSAPPGLDPLPEEGSPSDEPEVVLSPSPPFPPFPLTSDDIWHVQKVAKLQFCSGQVEQPLSLKFV